MDSLDVEGLVGSVLRGVLGGRPKRSRGALRYLTNGHSSLLNASTLLTVAGNFRLVSRPLARRREPTTRRMSAAMCKCIARIACDRARVTSVVAEVTRGSVR